MISTGEPETFQISRYLNIRLAAGQFAGRTRAFRPPSNASLLCAQETLTSDFLAMFRPAPIVTLNPESARQLTSLRRQFSGEPPAPQALTGFPLSSYINIVAIT